jgi:hypothetical protein
MPTQLAAEPSELVLPTRDDSIGVYSDAGAEADAAPSTVATAEEDGRFATCSAFNSASRSIALKWWLSKPLVHLVLIRPIMEPLRAFMASKIYIASGEYDAERTREIASGVDAQRGRRAYVSRVTLVADHIIEYVCLEQARLLMRDDTLWLGLPKEGLAVVVRCLVPRMISRLMASAHQLFIVPQQRFLVRLFARIAQI